MSRRARRVVRGLLLGPFALIPDHPLVCVCLVLGLVALALVSQVGAIGLWLTIPAMHAIHGKDWSRTRTLLVSALLEPHLKKRLRLEARRIQFQGCRAARHDDHMHIQMR